MSEATLNFFNNVGFMPHGMCYVWRSDIVALHVLSDGLIALAYFSIPVVLVLISRKRPDLLDIKLLYMFAAFITLCGITHLFGIWVIWYPDYIEQGFIKSLTALISFITALVLWKMLPVFNTLPSAWQLQFANQKLKRENILRKQAEVNLQRQQDLLHLLLENITDGVVACDSESKLILVNKTIRDWVGVELQGDNDPKNWYKRFKLFKNDSITQLSLQEYPLMRALRGEAVRNEEASLKIVGKESRVILSSGDPLFSLDGQKMGAVVAMRDITKRKREDEKLQKENEARMQKQQALLELAKFNFPDVDSAFQKIVKIDAEILQVSRVSVWLYNQERTAILCLCLCSNGEYVKDEKNVLNISDHPRYFKVIAQDSALTINDVQSDPRSAELFENFLSPKEITSMMDVPIRRAGNISGIICHEHIGPKRRWTEEEEDFAKSIADLCSIAIVADENKQITKALRKSELRFMNLFKYAPDAIIMSDANGRITLLNQQAEIFFGYKPEELIGQSVEILIPIDLRRSHERLRRGFINDPAVRSMGVGRDLFGLRKNGTKFPVDISLSPLDTAEGVMVTAAIRDVSEQQEIKEQILDYQHQLRALASKNSIVAENERRLLSKGLHDTIVQNLALLKIRLNTLLKNIAMSTENLSILHEVQQLLDLSIQQSRDLIFDLSPPILYELGLEAALEWLCEKQSQWHPDLHCEFNDDQQDRNLSEDLRIFLFQATRELLINVNKHAKAKNVKVAVSSQNNNVSITVEDDGIGFDKTILANIKSDHFGIFNITDNVKFLGGTCKIDTAPGKGSRISLILPISNIQ